MENSDITAIFKNVASTIEKQMKSDAVNKILKDKSKKYDLIIVEAYMEALLGLTHVFKAPVIQFSTVGVTTAIYKMYGAAAHPLIYPSIIHETLNNRTLWEKIKALVIEYTFSIDTDIDDHVNEVLRNVFGPEVPKLDELRNNVDMMFLNVHPMWDSNRPVPPNVVHLGGMHQKPAKDLPKERIKILVNVFSKLPYDILWKWNHGDVPGRTKNIRISKWLPQSDLLRHPKIKLFVTQCGLQSTDEAITAGVPLVGMPMFGDQKYNAAQYLHHGIGVIVDIETVTEEKLSNAITMILQDDSYRRNIVRLRTLMQDQPQTPLERAVWWTEYVIRHSGARHLRAAGAYPSFVEYYELYLCVYGLAALLAVVAGLVCSVRCCRKVWKSKEKTN
ncbi:UDP-glucuronosyltransferase 2B20-like [Ostrinia nubilalis]|uniref:UDP-glucuronosyltransferase 2B20-like n=1 Tax=Ostrinia nubilalis TaxID=29057 RepID=UPI0030826378